MLDNLCWLAVDSPNAPEFIYAQIVRDELRYGGEVKRFKADGKNLLDFLRDQPYTMCVIIGNAELAMGRFLVFYKFMEAFQVVSKEGLRNLLEFEVQRKSSGSKSPPRSPYRSRAPSVPRPNTPEALPPVLEGATPKN